MARDGVSKLLESPFSSYGKPDEIGFLDNVAESISSTAKPWPRRMRNERGRRMETASIEFMRTEERHGY
jgi:hypothetical protein